MLRFKISGKMYPVIETWLKKLFNFSFRKLYMKQNVHACNFHHQMDKISFISTDILKTFITFQVYSSGLLPSLFSSTTLSCATPRNNIYL